VTNDKVQPCFERLDADCFRARPAWAKQAFAYRLLHCITPPWLTRRLPAWLRLALLAPGVVLPPGLYLPPGWVVSPGTVFPPGWIPGDPVPPGVTILPGTVFPPGWTSGDPVPPGVTIPPGTIFPPGWAPGDPVPVGVTLDPGAEFPAGWTPGDPLPDGVTLDPGAEFPAGWTPRHAPPPGALPAPVIPIPPTASPLEPLHVKVFDAGPVCPRFPTVVIAGATWFWEPFDHLTTNAWTDYSWQSGSATIIAYDWLKLVVVDAGDYAMIARAGTYPYPDNYDIRIITNCIAGPGKTTFQFYTGVHRINFTVWPDNKIQYRWAGGTATVTVTDFMNTEVTWTIQVRTPAFNILQDAVAVTPFRQMESNTFTPGGMDIVLGTVGDIEIDEISIFEWY